MMGSINVIGEHLANQILHQINHYTRSPAVKNVLAMIGRDESRHVAAGRRFFPEVYPEFKKHRHRIMAKNLATTLVLTLAAYDLVAPMKALEIDLAQILDAMYAHYAEVTGGLPAFPDQAILDAALRMVRSATPRTIAAIKKITDDQGRVELGRLIALCERALKSPRSLRDLFSL
jgi:hypothetical protein